MPYWPLIDLFNRLWKIEEEDSPECVRQKLEVGIEGFLGRTERVPSVIGSLYSLPYPEFESVSPELWKAQLYEAVKNLLTAFAMNRPTIICIEDLHWADPPFVDLLRFILCQSTFPALFLCVFRPPFRLVTDEQLSVHRGAVPGSSPAGPFSCRSSRHDGIAAKDEDDAPRVEAIRS